MSKADPLHAAGDLEMNYSHIRGERRCVGLGEKGHEDRGQNGFH